MIFLTLKWIFDRVVLKKRWKKYGYWELNKSKIDVKKGISISMYRKKFEHFLTDKNGNPIAMRGKKNVSNRRTKRTQNDLSDRR